MEEIDIDRELDQFNSVVGLAPEDRRGIHQPQQWYKGERGRTDRIALVCFDSIAVAAKRRALKGNPNASSDELRAAEQDVLRALADRRRKSVEQLEAVEVLNTQDVRLRCYSAAFKAEVGFVEVPSSIPFTERSVWKKLGEPRTYLTTLALIYRTDRDGEVESDSVDRGWKILPWRFTSAAYDTLHKIDKGLREAGSNISQVDLTVSCLDTVYQKITITQAGPALYRKNPAFMHEVLERSLPLYDRLRPFRKMTTEDLREKLGMPAPPAMAPRAVSLEFGDILEGI